jgi:hypothetical protein
MDVLEPVPTEVAERDAGQVPGELRNQPPCRLGQHHLAAVRGGTDPRGEVHVLADVTLAVPLRLAGVQTHPYPQWRALRPFVGLEGALRRHRRPHRVVCRREDDEEAVALGAHLLAVRLPAGRPDDRPLCLQGLTPPRPEPP